MPIEWSGLGPELLLALDRRDPEPLRSQLEGQLREAIRTGRLRAGERLPSSRELARELGLSRGLVQDCYGQLQAEGYLSTQVGSATRVAVGAATEIAQARAAQPGAAAARAATAPAGPAQAGPAQAGPAQAAPAARLQVDFRSGVPDLASFPRGDWL
jgi:GntR family transcriptional regulator/MocR family aminotransferase